MWDLFITARLPSKRMSCYAVLQAAGGSAARRLFDREPDNQHEEPLLLSQLAANQLRCLSVGHPRTLNEQQGLAGCEGVTAESGGGFKAVHQAWLLSSSERLSRASSGLGLLLQQSFEGGGSPGGNWAGGLANHPSTFPFLFRCLLPFWAVHPSLVAAGGDMAVDEAGPSSGRGVSDVVRSRLQESLRTLCSQGGLESGPLVPLVVAVARQWDVRIPSNWNVNELEDQGNPLFLLSTAAQA